MHRSVIVTVVAMRVVSVAVHKIINMVPVRHGGMATVLAVNVAGGLPASTMARRAYVHGDDMVLRVGAVDMMHVFLQVVCKNVCCRFARILLNYECRVNCEAKTDA